MNRVAWGCMEKVLRELPAVLQSALDGHAGTFHVQAGSGRKSGIARVSAIRLPALGSDELDNCLDVVVGENLLPPSRFGQSWDVGKGPTMAFFGLPEDPVARASSDAELAEDIRLVLIAVTSNECFSDSGLLGGV